MISKRSFTLIVFIAYLFISLGFQTSPKFKILFEKAKFTMETKGDLKTAITLFNEIIKKYPNEREYAARSQFYIGLCNEKLGNAEARKAYEIVLSKYADQPGIVNEARARLLALKQVDDDGINKTEITNRLIWAGKDVDIQGAPSSDGQYLSYTDSKKNSLAIYNLKTGDRTFLRNPDSLQYMSINESVWSPDGKQLAYGKNDEDHGIGEIHLINLDGSGERKLCTVDTSYYVWVEDWSRDGKMILAVLDGNDKKIALVSVSDGTVRIIKTMSNWNWGLSHKLFFSPDGRFIAYSSPTEKKSKSCDVFVIAIDGSNEINITQHPDDDRVLGWNPDGSRLLFASNRGGGYSIWAIPIVNGQPQEYPKLVKDNIGKISPMGLTSDGSFYYSVTSAKESNIYLASIDPQTGKIVSQPKAATMQNNGFNHSFAWSPDGKKLLYLSDFFRITNDNWNKTFMLTPETGLEKRVVSQIASDTVIAYNWFPDGKHLAVVGIFSDGSKGICKLNIQNGKLIPILTSKSKDTTYWFPSVSPDGKSIFTHTWLKNNQSIYSYDIEKKEKKLLFQSGKDRYIYSVRLSSDGKQLAFILMTTRPEEFPALMVMSSSGGEATAIYRNNIPGQFGNFAWYYGLDWSPDGQYIYFAKRPDSVSPYELLRIPVQGGSPEQTGVEMEGLHCISIRPDGKQIAFSAGADPKQEIWVLENIFADARTQPTKLNGLTTRRILEDATDIGEVLTADGKYTRKLDRSTGDVVQFDIVSQQTTRIKNTGSWSENDKYFEYQLFSKDGKQVAYDTYSKDDVHVLMIRNLDGSDLRTLYTYDVSYIQYLDWSPDTKSILVIRGAPNKTGDLALISTVDGKVNILKSLTSAWFMLYPAFFSPDGQFIAYSFVRESSRPNGDVFVMTADGKNEEVVVGHPAEDQLLAWTPNGKGLIFLSNRSGTWDIWTIPVDNGKNAGESELLKKDFGYNQEVIGFEPGGSLFYKTNTEIGGLYTGSIDFETGKILVPPSSVTTRYTGPPVMLLWSPDSKDLLYVSRPLGMGAGNNILTIRSNSTGEERFLSPPLRYINQISWAPDGRSILALGFTEKETGIYRIDSKTSDITKLPVEAWGGRGLAPKLCSDGKTLVFVGEGPTIRTRNLDTGEESEVVKVRSVQYDISPDGRQVVFQINGIIKIVSINGGESRDLFSKSSKSYGLKWTMDGRYIIARELDTSPSNSEIWKIPVNGETPLKLNMSVPKIVSFALHPDNSHFAYSVKEGTKSELWVMENFLPKEIREDKAFKIRKVSDFDTEGAVSPDGKYLSYVDWNSGNGELAIYDIATGEKRHLTNYGSESEAFSLYSRWSPDSKQLVYDWYDENGRVALNIVGIDGSKPRILYNNKEVLWAQTFGWSPDGKNILAIFYRKTNYQIVLVSTADGSVRDLKTLESSDLHMCFSPDSRYIVYDFQQKEDSPDRDISILPIDGASEISLVKHPANDYVLGWTPDGKNILFASDRGNNLGAWVIQFSDGKVQGVPKLIKANIGQVYPMGFTQNGSFYYGINDVLREIYLAELDPGTIKITALPKKLSTHFEGPLTQPTYSPDGKYIAYTLHIMSNDVLCIHSLENDQEKYFYSKLKRIQQLRWFPDGHSILLGGWDMLGKKGIYSLDVQSGIFSIIVPPAKESSEMFLAGIELSPNGKEIFLTRISNNLTQIMSRNLVSGIEKELYRESHRTSIDFSCSPDGKWLALMQVVEERVLKIIPVAGGEPKELIKFKKNDNPAFFKWTPDGKHIIFTNLNSDGKIFSLWQISPEGGEVEKVGLESNYRLNASIHPDGKHIVFSLPVSSGENSGNWVMENFLPKENREKK